jgi:hypothetical protein
MEIRRWMYFHHSHLHHRLLATWIRSVLTKLSCGAHPPFVEGFDDKSKFCGND